MVFKKINRMEPLSSFQCNYCEQNYSRKGFLVSHAMHSHRNERVAGPKGQPALVPSTKSGGQSSKLGRRHNGTIEQIDLTMVSPQTTVISLRHPYSSGDVQLNCYECPYCKLTFTLKMLLRAHVATHTDNAQDINQILQQV